MVLRKVGAIDAVAYRQLTGCSPKLVAKELAGIKDQGLMIQKGRARGTYYVPAEILLEGSKETTSNFGQVETAPASGETAPVRRGNTPAQRETTTPPSVTTTPPPVTTTPPPVTTTPLPANLLAELENLKQHVSSQRMKDLIVCLCEIRPMTKEDLMSYLKRSSVTIDKYITLMIGKELDYLYPMMVHHPRQAYVASDKLKGTA